MTNLFTAHGDEFKQLRGDQVADASKSTTRGHPYHGDIPNPSKSSEDDLVSPTPQVAASVSDPGPWRNQQPRRPENLSRPLPQPPCQSRSDPAPPHMPPSTCAANAQASQEMSCTKIHPSNSITFTGVLTGLSGEMGHGYSVPPYVTLSRDHPGSRTESANRNSSRSTDRASTGDGDWRGLEADEPEDDDAVSMCTPPPDYHSATRI